MLLDKGAYSLDKFRTKFNRAVPVPEEGAYRQLENLLVYGIYRNYNTLTKITIYPIRFIANMHTINAAIIYREGMRDEHEGSCGKTHSGTV